LDADIVKAERETRALENTVRLLTSRNQTYHRSLARVHDTGQYTPRHAPRPAALARSSLTHTHTQLENTVRLLTSRNQTYHRSLARVHDTSQYTPRHAPRPAALARSSLPHRERLVADSSTGQFSTLLLMCFPCLLAKTPKFCLIFTARCYASAVLAIALCPCLCLSVSASVTSRSSAKTAKHRIT